jgi:hypothetical protein
MTACQECGVIATNYSKKGYFCDACQAIDDREQENEQLTRERDGARETARALLKIAETALHQGIAFPGRIPLQVALARRAVDTWEEQR